MPLRPHPSRVLAFGVRTVPHLGHGRTVALAAPASAVGPDAVRRAEARLTAAGLRVVYRPDILAEHNGFAGTDERRAAELLEHFANPRVAAIFCVAAGYGSLRVLPHLDFDLIRANPKIFMGFSDITVLNVAIWQRTGLVTFNGPALLTDFGENPGMLGYTREIFLRTVTRPSPPGLIQPSSCWTEEFQDWAEKKDLERPRSLLQSDGWTWLKPGWAEGRLVGGCIESLQHLRGTSFWPNWQGAVWFFETSEEKPSPADVDGMLMDYQNMGVLDQLAGLLVGRPMRYTPAEKEELRQVVLERTRGYAFPVVTDMDFGHTAPQLTLPIGCLARIDSTQQAFEILESAVE